MKVLCPFFVLFSESVDSAMVKTVTVMAFHYLLSLFLSFVVLLLCSFNFKVPPCPSSFIIILLCVIAIRKFISAALICFYDLILFCFCRKETT